MLFFFSRLFIAFIVAIVAVTALAAIMPPSTPPGILSAVEILPVIWAYTWFGRAISRRYAHRRKRLFWPYALANLTFAGLIAGLGLSASLVLFDLNNNLPAVLFPVVLIISVMYFGSALASFRGAYKNQRDTGIFWLFLRPVAFINTAFNTVQAINRDYQANRNDEGKGQSISDVDDGELFRSILIFGESHSGRGISIPADIDAVPIQQKSRFPWNRSRQPAENCRYGSVQIHSAQNRFVAEAQRYSDATASKTSHVPFKAYYPTYSDMSASQRKWYFYWRSEVRKGNFLATDLSYQFVYIYELLNIVGVDSPQAAFDRLNRFWKAYRGSQPKLDNYLLNWLGDFIVVHRLPFDILNWYWQCSLIGAHERNCDDIVFEGWVLYKRDFRYLPAEVIYRVAGYDPARNKFYRDQPDSAEIDRLIMQSIQAVDVFLRRQAGQGLIETVTLEPTHLITRMPFISANHGYDIQQIKVAEVHPWSTSEPFADGLHTIVRATENILRKQQNYRSLPNVTIPQDWHEVILSVVTPETSGVEINIDLDAVAELSKESRKLRQRLIIDEESEYEGPDFPHIPVSDHEDEEVKDLRDERTDKALPTQSEESAVVIDFGAAASLQMESETLRWRLRVDDDVYPEREAAMNPAEERYIPDRAPIVSPSRDDDHANVPDNAIGAPGGMDTSTGSNNDTLLVSPLSDDWEQLAEAFSSYEIEVLMALLSQNGKEDAVEHICRAVNLTTSRVIDDINELALDTIGDNIIDVTQSDLQFIEEYEHDVQALLTRSKFHRNMEDNQK